MKSRGSMRTTCLLTAAILGPGCLIAAPPDVPAQPVSQCEDVNYQAEASQLLRQVRSNAVKLASDADVLGSYARSGISREGHAKQINLVRDHINAIGKRLERLQTIRHVVAPWQQYAIDSVMPIAVNLAAHTEAAIQHLTDGRNPVWAQNYTDLLHAISNRSDSMKEAIGLHLEMAGTQSKLDRLRDRAGALGL